MVWNLRRWLLVLQDGGVYEGSWACVDGGLFMHGADVRRVCTIGVACVYAP